MKRTGALMPHRAAPMLATIGDVARSTTVQLTMMTMSKRRPPPLSYVFLGFLIMLFYCCHFDVVLANENGDIMNGYSLGPDMTSTTEFGKYNDKKAILIEIINFIISNFAAAASVANTASQLRRYYIEIERTF